MDMLAHLMQAMSQAQCSVTGSLNVSETVQNELENSMQKPTRDNEETIDTKKMHVLASEISLWGLSFTLSRF